MKYDQATNLVTLEDRDDANLASEVLFASRKSDDPKENRQNPEATAIRMPWTFGEQASIGLLGSLERAAKGEIGVSVEVQTLAVEALVKINQQRGVKKAPGILTGIIAALEYNHW